LPDFYASRRKRPSSSYRPFDGIADVEVFAATIGLERKDVVLVVDGAGKQAGNRVGERDCRIAGVNNGAAVVDDLDVGKADRLGILNP
jgi:hypothetical protein